MAVLNQDRYRELAPEHVSIFGQPYWLDAICPNTWDAIVIEGHNSLILWPYHFKKKWGFKAMLMPEVSLFMGPFVQGIPTATELGELLNQLSEFDKIAYQTHHGFNLPEFLPSSEFGFKKRTHYELNPKQYPEEDYNTLTSRKLKKRAADVQLTKTFNPNAFIALSRESYKAQGVETPFSEETIHRLIQVCKEQSCGHIVEAYTPSGVAAAAWIVYDKKTTYYFLSGIDRSLPDYGAIVKIIHQAINETFESNKTFNFYGSEVPGVARFMRGFGALPSYSYLLEYTGSPVVKIADKIRNR